MLNMAGLNSNPGQTLLETGNASDFVVECQGRVYEALYC